MINNEYISEKDIVERNNFINLKTKCTNKAF